MTDLFERLKLALSDRYTIERKLGAGGMATVYLAYDVKHDRKVAVKVLRPELAAVIGTERFLNEIKITANLSHPHILPLLDSGTAEEPPSARPPDRPSAFLYYVMPYLEGESLRERLDREKQLSIEDAIDTAKAVAGALDYAHRQNVIHRDIKPENILLHDGQPVVADFGISLAVSAAGGTRLTETGLSLGTPQYMSPEQATGDREIDGRSDIYSLACVLYEMLSGEPPHTGPTVQAVIAKVVTDRPRPIGELRETVPLHVATALHKALTKLPADRFAGASDLVEALSKPGTLDVSVFATRQLDATQHQSLSKIKRVAIGGWVTAVALLVLAAWFAFTGGSNANPDTPARHLSITLPDSAPLAFSGPAPVGIWQRAIAISRDSRTVAYVAPHGATTRLLVRHLDDTSVVVLPGTEGAYHPFFSPDGTRVGFFTGLELWTAQVAGGQPVLLAQDLVTPVGASWGDDDRILVADREGRAPIWVSAAGVERDTIGDLGVQFETPHLLPGGEWAVGTNHFGAQLALLSLQDGRVLAITRGGVTEDSAAGSNALIGFNPTYSPSGHILYMSAGDGVLMALPFDADRREVLGDPQPVLNGVRKEETYGFGQFAMSDDGLLVYAPGGNADYGHLAFVDARMQIDTLPFPRRQYESIHLSPDGNRIVVQIKSEMGERAAHVLDLRREQTEPLREHGFPEGWTRNGADLLLRIREGAWMTGISRRAVVYSMHDASTRDIELQDPVWVEASPREDIVAWTRRADGMLLVHQMFTAADDVQMPEVGGQPSFSPDGRWIAYLRTTDGVVRLSPYPPTGQLFQISSGRGEQPKWSQAGDRLIYRDGRRFWEVEFSTANGDVELSAPRPLVEGPFNRPWSWSYDIAPDGRLLVVVGAQEGSVDHINVVTNFHSVLDSLAPRR